MSIEIENILDLLKAELKKELAEDFIEDIACGESDTNEFVKNLSAKHGESLAANLIMSLLYSAVNVGLVKVRSAANGTDLDDDIIYSDVKLIANDGDWMAFDNIEFTY